MITLRTGYRLFAVLFCLSLAPALMAGNRTLTAQGRWVLSVPQKPAIVHTGYDYAPTVLFDDRGYRMWWCGAAPSGNPYVDHIWAAESEDGLNWTNIRMVMQPAPLAHVCDPSVIRIGGTYMMYFTGTSDPNGSNNQIYLATSTDGALWKKWPDDSNPQPIVALPATITGYGIGQPSVVFRGIRFWLYYTDTTREGGGTFLASSLDGTTFRPENEQHRLLATNSVDVKYSTALQAYVMVHGSSHNKLYFSSSADGIHWEAQESARFLALSQDKNKAFEGCLAGSATGTIGSWSYYYYASHQGTPGLIQDPLNWDIDVGRLSFSSLPPAGTVFQSVAPSTINGDHLYDTRPITPLLYDYEYRSFSLDTTPNRGLAIFFRLYHPQVQDHFYTADPLEKSLALVLGYLDEGILGYVSPAAVPGYTALYRLYHPKGDHFYTIDPNERERRKTIGYRDEGVSAYVWGVDRSGRPDAPQVLSFNFFTPTDQVQVNYDTGNLPGAYDVRLEVSQANQSFQAANSSVADPLARISVRLTGNAGSYRIATGGFPDGRYQVRVAAFDEAGLPVGSYSASSSFSIGTPPPPDTPPFGFIDVPAEGETTSGPLVVHGWALDDHGVSRAEVFIDGQSRGLATRGFPRPDVKQVYPAYPNSDSSGYLLETNISRLATGQHLILVELTDTEGQKTLLGPRMIRLVQGNNQAPFGFLDLPSEGTVRSGVLEIGGWALDDRGMSRVEIYVDGAKAGNAIYRVLRPDVAVVFPGFPDNPNSGFTAVIDAAPLLPGTHQLLIRLIDNQGLSADLPVRSFTRP